MAGIEGSVLRPNTGAGVWVPGGRRYPCCLGCTAVPRALSKPVLSDPSGTIHILHIPSTAHMESRDWGRVPSGEGRDDMVTWRGHT
jgi:hypothetical protein